jgi:hypothetical protein
VAALLVAGALACVLAPPAVAATTVTVAVLPRDTTVEELARVPGVAPGVMGAGIGGVPSEQTFLDISQGNRIDGALYDRRLPGLFPFAREVPGWPAVIARAEDAPADLIPGLLVRRLRSAGVSASAERPLTASALIAADPVGVVTPLHGCADRCLAVVTVSVPKLAGLARDLGGDDLLIAIASPPPDPDRALAIGIAGRGFGGNLTSNSTRTDGYVLSTDVAPAILRRFGVPIPDEMDGEPIRAEGSVDPEAIKALADRMEVIPGRRAPLLIVCLGGWIALALALAGLGRGRAGAAWAALCFAYLPLMLLAAAALEPPAVAEGVLVGVGGGVLAAITLGLFAGWRAPAIACAITVIAYAVDVVAGSDLTRLSLLGPNPIYGVRFYGLGNELEALFAVMVPVGVGAGLSAYSGWGRAVTRRAAICAFVAAGIVGAIVFGAGRFGADVGAAIVLPVGAAVAAVSLPVSDFVDFPGDGPGESTRLSRGRIVAAVVAAPLIALVSLALIDLVSGGNAHLTRSVLDAGGAGDLADVAQRRLELSARDFAQAAGNPLFWLLIALIGAAIWQWRRIDAWLRPAPFVRAGVLGASAAVGVGVLVNDSGATFLALGACALGASIAFAWTQATEIQ